MLAKFKEDQRSIAISSIECLNFQFCDMKLCIKNKFNDRILNNIRSEERRVGKEC